MDPLSAGALIFDIGSSLFGAHKKNKAQAKQRKLQEQQQQLSEAEYYQRQQRIQDWNEKYGSIEQNMLESVRGLDASTIYANNEGSINNTFKHIRQTYDSYLADRGFDVSGGVSAEMFSALADQEARTKMEYQQKADQYVRQQQQAVLSGHPQPQVVSTTGMQQGLINQSNLAAQGANNFITSLDTIGTTLGRFAGYEQAQQQAELDKKLEKAKIDAINRYSPTAKEVL